MERKSVRAVEVVRSRRLLFDDGRPVRAASAVARLGEGWLVAQDDAIDAAWWRGPSVQSLRLVSPVEGRPVFGSSDSSKHLKPDFEAACPVRTTAGDGVLLLGSGSLPARTSGVLVHGPGGSPRVDSVELAPLYARVAEVLGIAPAQLNMEGACLVGPVLRWFQRGSSAQALASASVDIDLAALLAVFAGQRPAEEVPVGRPFRYELGDVDGVALAVTDAVALRDGRLLLSAAAEDTPNAVDDGPVVGSALVLLDGHVVTAVLELPALDGRMPKVEGLAVALEDSSGVTLLAVVDEDVEGAPSTALELRLT